jgi:glycosyltransferase involved in cell wall biosynthesis
VTPRISILLPNLNNRPFLNERLATIAAQTVQDWELVVSDNFSDDGAWEFLQEAAARDSRICAAQAPREGMYENWNRCIVRARGEFIYIATSDDTMTDGCLAKLIAALDAHPNCDIAQCCLHAIDHSGAVIPGWWRLAGLARFLGDDYLRPHVRRAPFDGVLHAAMHTQYHSITQILIRRRVFEKTGPFPPQYASGGDFCWGMKAGFTCNIVHVPEFLATWRIHDAQASTTYHETAAERLLMARMVDEALAARMEGSAAARLPAGPMRFLYRYEHYQLAYAEAKSRLAKIRVVASMARDPSVLARALGRRLAGGRHRINRVEYTRRLLRRLKLESHFEPLPGPATPAPL